MEKLPAQQPNSRSDLFDGIRVKLIKGEVTPQEAYDGYIELGCIPSLAGNTVFEDLGGADFIYSDEIEEKNRQVSELMKDLVRIPDPEPDNDYMTLREIPEKDLEKFAEGDLFSLTAWKLVNQKITAREAVDALKELGGTEEEWNELVGVIESQMRAAAGSSDEVVKRES